MCVFQTTIVIPMYNRVRFIKHALESALRQSLPAEAIIVVDDGSTDGSAELVKKEFPCVRLIRIENNGSGPSRPRNVGIEAATTEFITLLDSDDILFPSLLAKHGYVLSRWPDVGLVSVNFMRDYGAGQLEENTPRLLRQCDKVAVDGACYKLAANAAYSAMCVGNNLPGSGNSFRRSVWQEVGGWDETLSTANDYDFFIRILRNYALAYIDEPLACYVLHHDNISGANRTREFKPHRYHNVLRVLRRELARASNTSDRNALLASIAHFELDCAWESCEAGQFVAAFRGYWRALATRNQPLAALRGLAALPVKVALASRHVASAASLGGRREL